MPAVCQYFKAIMMLQNFMKPMGIAGESEKLIQKIVHKFFLVFRVVTERMLNTTVYFTIFAFTLLNVLVLQLQPDAFE